LDNGFLLFKRNLQALISQTFKSDNIEFVWHDKLAWSVLQVKKNGKNIYLADDVDQDYNLRLSFKFDNKDLKIEKNVFYMLKLEY
jgi:hypothetical protein